MDKTRDVQVSSTAKPLDDMTPEERLESLRAFAEEQNKYIQPNSGAIIPGVTGNDGGFNTVAFSNPNQGGSMSFKMGPTYDGHLAHSSWHPPVEQERTRTPSPFKKFMDKRHEKKEAKANKEDADDVIR